MVRSQQSDLRHASSDRRSFLHRVEASVCHPYPVHTWPLCSNWGRSARRGWICGAKKQPRLRVVERQQSPVHVGYSKGYSLGYTGLHDRQRYVGRAGV